MIKCHESHINEHYESEFAQSCPTLCNPMHCSLPGSSVHGTFQARVLEWVAISFSRVSSRPRDRTHVFCIGRRVLYHLRNPQSLIRHEPDCPLVLILTWSTLGKLYLPGFALPPLMSLFYPPTLIFFPGFFLRVAVLNSSRY